MTRLLFNGTEIMTFKAQHVPRRFLVTDAEVERNSIIFQLYPHWYIYLVQHLPNHRTSADVAHSYSIEAHENFGRKQAFRNGDSHRDELSRHRRTKMSSFFDQRCIYPVFNKPPNKLVPPAGSPHIKRLPTIALRSP